MAFLRNWFILITGLSITAASAALQAVLMVLLLPWKPLRIKACNYYGWFLGSTLMKLSGCPMEFKGMENMDGNRPAIYISNHTSIADIFLAIWVSPVGTVGVAKKEVVYYPFFGQLYWLSGHLRIDRGNTRAALKSLHELRDTVNANNLSIWIWPEGTRSRDGRMLPFRKGVIHLAKQTGLPIVPVVVTGAHKCWEKNTLRIRRVPITVTALPAIETSDWKKGNMREHLAELERMFAEVLPEDQKPKALEAAA